MNSYMNDDMNWWVYAFMYTNSNVKILNSYKNSLVYEFIQKNSFYPIWIHESDFIDVNSSYEFITEN